MALSSPIVHGLTLLSVIVFLLGAAAVSPYAGLAGVVVVMVTGVAIAYLQRRDHVVAIQRRTACVLDTLSRVEGERCELSRRLAIRDVNREERAETTRLLLEQVLHDTGQFALRLKRDCDAGRPIGIGRRFEVLAGTRIATEPEYAKLRERLATLNATTSGDLAQRPVYEFLSDVEGSGPAETARHAFDARVEEALVLCQEIGRMCRGHLTLLDGHPPVERPLIDVAPGPVRSACGSRHAS